MSQQLELSLRLRAFQSVLDALLEGTATRGHIEALVDSCPMALVQIQVRRREPAPHGQPIHLLPGNKGPLSMPGKPVELVSSGRWHGVWAAWWSIAECRRWLEETSK
ncbi:MAG: hypothetical protein M0R28_17875 [Pigmentiphaga sp.]|nr:hypothetical protein [Pigmentiphaga sp.]